MKFIEPQYYAPTGMALGFPLPNDELAGSLNAAAKAIADHTHVCCNSNYDFRLVPAKAFHITIVNRDHYGRPERISGEVSGEMEYLSEKELTLLQDAVSELAIQRISITIERLILKDGKLIALPNSWKQISTIRDAIREKLPTLKIMSPSTAHIKLGQFNKIPSLSILDELEDIAASYDVTGNLVFYDAYTPVGRIVF